MKLRKLPALRRGFIGAAAFIGFLSCGSIGPRLVAQAPAAPNPPASEPAGQDAASQTPTIRTNVDEVSLDIVVHDKSKKLILDLKPEDLAISDNDTPVKLQNLRLVKGDTTRKHTVTFVFDPFIGPTAKSARSAAEKILKVLPSENYSYSVLDMRGRMRVIQGFTPDRDQAERAIEVATESNVMRLDTTLSQDLSIVTEHADAGRTKVVEEAEKNLILIARTGADSAGNHYDVTQRGYAQTLVAAMQEAQKSLQDKKSFMNLGSLLALIHSQQKLGDRKALIYFTHNMIMDSAAKEMLKTISGDSTRAGVTIYIVDLDSVNTTRSHELANATQRAKPQFSNVPQVINAHGDVGVAMQQIGGGGIVGDPSASGPQWGTKQDIEMMTDFTRQGPMFDFFSDDKSPMAQLSRDTGGIYIDAQTNTKKLLEQMVEDMGTYYEATYIPPVKEYDGSFRTISVTPLRKNIRVQSKTGYFAVAPGTDSGIRSFEVPLVKSLAEAALPTDIKFRASVLRFGELPDGNTNTFALEIPYSDLQVKEDAHTNLFSTQVAVFAQIKDASGAVVEQFGEDINRRGALETLDRDHSAALSFERHFISTPGKYTLEVAVTDHLSGKTGAQRRAFEIPGTPNTVGLSDMVLVRKMTTVGEDDQDALNPLRYEHDRITPNLSEHLPDGAKGISMFVMLHPDPASKEPATLEMEVIHNGVPGRRTPLPYNRNEIQTAVPYLASFGTGSLAPGKYEVKAYLEQGGKTAEQSLGFTVGDGSSPAAESLAAKTSGAGVTAIAAAPEVTIPGQLTITAAKNRVPPLSPQDAHQLIEDARERALGYGESLPNFMCIEVTSRSTDSSGMGNWKLKDTIVELLKYRDKHESRTTVEVNGQASSTSHDAMKGSLSEGEFGGVLKSVFKPESKATFVWKETDELNGGAVQVFDYTVEQEHSSFGVVGTDGREVMAGFHGQVFIDGSTRNVRRISLIADLPEKFSTRASTLRVDYDYVGINGHDYLLPVTAEMRLVKGKHQAALNTIEFRNYRRFGSNMKILGFTPIDAENN